MKEKHLNTWYVSGICVCDMGGQNCCTVELNS